ncbi:unnamed protein product [Rhizophagus irregularis]|uniref:Uncharacterized protein n=1 Tax=Rhizophagus irregularis TaxID=588596 RepID=A0A915ZJU6_9GLOM|nr:unnamed protein product [Rhizophagus irregularis]
MTYGKCNYRNLQTGVKCGCLRSRVQSINDHSCKACKHDLNYHEINQHQTSKSFANLKNNCKNKIYSHKKFNITFKLINIVGEKPNQKVPRDVKKSGKMKSICFTEDSNIGIKNVVESSFPHFMNKRWQFFRLRRTSISDLEIACEPNFGWSIDALKSIACTRRKLYVGIVHEPIQMTSSLIYQPIRSDNITSEVSGSGIEQFLQQNLMSLDMEFAM